MRVGEPSWTNSAFREDEDAQTALDWLQRDYVRQFARRHERWLDAAHGWPALRADVLGSSDTFVTVTPAQMRELQTRWNELMSEFRSAGDGDPAARRVLVYTYAHPVDLEPPEPAS